MKIKLTEYTDPEGQKHYITSFRVSMTSDVINTQEITPTGDIEMGPRIHIKEMVYGTRSRCREIVAELVLP